MDTINSMKKTLGERIREQRILMQMTQEELAEELCVKKSTISMYENDKVDIKGSILIELSGVLHTSPNYLLGMEEYEEDLLEIITVYKLCSDCFRQDCLIIDIIIANRIGTDETTGDYELGTLIKKCRYPQKFHEHH